MTGRTFAELPSHSTNRCPVCGERDTTVNLRLIAQERIASKSGRSLASRSRQLCEPCAVLLYEAAERAMTFVLSGKEEPKGKTMTDLELVLEATERILKGYPENLTEEERDEQESEDAALCAAYIQEQQAKAA